MAPKGGIRDGPMAFRSTLLATTTVPSTRCTKTVRTCALLVCRHGDRYYPVAGRPHLNLGAVQAWFGSRAFEMTFMVRLLVALLAAVQLPAGQHAPGPPPAFQGGQGRVAPEVACRRPAWLHDGRTSLRPPSTPLESSPRDEIGQPGFPDHDHSHGGTGNKHRWRCLQQHAVNIGTSHVIPRTCVPVDGPVLALYCVWRLICSKSEDEIGLIIHAP